MKKRTSSSECFCFMTFPASHQTYIWETVTSKFKDDIDHDNLINPLHPPTASVRLLFSLKRWCKVRINNHKSQATHRWSDPPINNWQTGSGYVGPKIQTIRSSKTFSPKHLNDPQKDVYYFRVAGSRLCFLHFNWMFREMLVSWWRLNSNLPIDTSPDQLASSTTDNIQWEFALTGNASVRWPKYFSR